MNSLLNERKHHTVLNSSFSSESLVDCSTRNNSPQAKRSIKLSSNERKITDGSLNSSDICLSVANNSTDYLSPAINEVKIDILTQLAISYKNAYTKVSLKKPRNILPL